MTGRFFASRSRGATLRMTGGGISLKFGVKILPKIGTKDKVGGLKNCHCANFTKFTKKHLKICRFKTIFVI